MSEPLTPEQQQELLAKVDALTKTVEEQKQFVEDASILTTAITSNPALKTQVIQAISAQQQPPTPPAPPTPPVDKSGWKFDPETGRPIQTQQQPPTPPAPPTPPVDPRIDSLDARERQQIVERIESKYGYTKLPDDKRKDMRAKVAERMKNWGREFWATPVHILPQVLEDAYVQQDLSTMNPETDKDKIGALMSASKNDIGAFPSMQSTATPTDAVTVTPEQAKWGERMGISQDKIAANLKELTEHGKMTYKPKDTPAATAVVTPSGSPTPPAPAPAT